MLIWARLQTAGFTINDACDSLAQMSARHEIASAAAGLSRAWYGASVLEFLSAQPGCVLGELATNGHFILVPEQKDAWLAQIGFLQSLLSGITGLLFLVQYPEEWARAPYRPTPTIIEAARALYAQHSVEAIARCDAQGRISGLVD